MEDEQARARRALAESFRRERAEMEARAAADPRRDKPARWRPSGRMIAGLVILLVVAAIAVPVVIVGGATLQRLQIEDSVKQFCGAEAAGDYTAAYQLLSRRARAKLSQDQFAATLQQADLLGCAVDEGGLRFSVRGNQAEVHVALLIGDGTDSTGQEVGGTMTLMNEDGGWHIDLIGGFGGQLFG
jgi:hypothetical protein